jgi:hypothetical protein
MSKKSYTFEDWLNVKVVLNTTKGIPNEVSEENIVSINDFDTEEIKKIQEKQKSVFNELLDKEFEKIESEFFSKFKNSQVSKLLIKRELESLKALIGNKFICENGSYRSPIKGDNKTFLDWYYRSMMNHKINSMVGGNGDFYDEIPSPNSCFYDNGRIPPEVMISVVLKMFSFLSVLNSNTENKVKLKEISQNKTKEQIVDVSVSETSSDEENDKWKLFFVNRDYYDFFLFCKNKLPSNGKKLKKNNGVETTSELSKYSNIFHFFLKEKLIYKHIKHEPFIEYLIDEQKVLIPSKTKTFPYRYSKFSRSEIEKYFLERFPPKKKESPKFY